jgi:hypothetical protein
VSTLVLFFAVSLQLASLSPADAAADEAKPAREKQAQAADPAQPAAGNDPPGISDFIEPEDIPGAKLSPVAPEAPEEPSLVEKLSMVADQQLATEGFATPPKGKVLHQPREPLPDPATQKPFPWLWATLLAVGLAGAFFLGYRIWLLALAGNGPAPEVILRQRLEWAERELSEGDARAFASEVADALREYIEQACGIKARSQTTEEFLPKARESPLLHGSMADALSRFLDAADRLRFAGRALNPAELEAMKQSARDFLGLACSGKAEDEEAA